MRTGKRPGSLYGRAGKLRRKKNLRSRLVFILLPMKCRLPFTGALDLPKKMAKPPKLTPFTKSCRTVSEIITMPIGTQATEGAQEHGRTNQLRLARQSCTH